jgi:hypothetical protein
MFATATSQRESAVRFFSKSMLPVVGQRLIKKGNSYSNVVIIIVSSLVAIQCGRWNLLSGIRGQARVAAAGEAADRQLPR